MIFAILCLLLASLSSDVLADGRILLPNHVEYVLKSDDAIGLGRMLDEGVNPNDLYFRLKTEEFLGDMDPGGTLPMYSCVLGATNCLWMLVDRDADMGKTNQFGHTMLHYAAKLPQEEAFRLAQTVIAKTSITPLDKDKFGQTALWSALSEDNAAYAEWLINSGCRPDRYAICLCVFGSDSVNSLKLLLARELLDVNNSLCPGSEEYQWRPLPLACATRAVKCLHLLVSVNADLSVNGKNGDGGWTLLHSAASLPPKESVWLAGLVMLRTRFGIDDSEGTGKTPLWFALKRGNAAYAKWLIDNGATFGESLLPTAIDSPQETFLLCLEHPAISRLEPSQLTELLLKMSPFAWDYDFKVLKLVEKGADINLIVKKKSFLRRILDFEKEGLQKLTAERLEGFRRLGLSESSMRDGIAYAKRRKIADVTRLMEDCLSH